MKRIPATELAWATSDTAIARRERRAMVSDQLAFPCDRRTPIQNPSVLQAMERIPRHFFVPTELQDQAYADRALPIGIGQTISQPYIVARMLEELDVQPGSRVLDIGTGSGYQAALLAELGAQVFSVEVQPELFESARERLKSLEYSNIFLRLGDANQGWPEHAPYARIVAACVAPQVPEALGEQLSAGGRIVMPLEEEDGTQTLYRIEKSAQGAMTRHQISGVHFVPFIGSQRASEVLH